MAKFIFLTTLITIGLYLNAQSDDCPAAGCSWTTEKEAIACIETTNYNYVETIMCNEASNIKIAQYYSCTKDRGYLIVKTDRKTYLHTDVPYGVWIDLKEAKSTSGYYNFYLKNRFKFNGEPSQSPVL